MTGSNLVSLIEAKARDRQTFIVPANQIRLKVAPKGVAFNDNGDYAANVAPTFIQDLAGYTRGKASFYEEQWESHPEEMANLINVILRDKNEDRMIRSIGSTVDALLSPRYKVFDDHHLLSVIEKAVPAFDHGGWSISPCSTIGSERTHIKVVGPRKQFDVEKGDPVQVGFVASNSEIGRGTVEIAVFIMRLVCTNGMIIQRNLYSHVSKHIGREWDPTSIMTPVEKDWESREAIQERLLGVINEVASSNGDLQAMLTQGASNVIRDKTPEEVFKALVAWAPELYKDEDATLLELWEGTPSQWIYSNAITEFAKTQSNRRVALESLGGRLALMSGPRFDHVLRTAA